MKKTPIFQPQWLDIISCCGKKTQLSIISAIVKYQADGTLPDFKGIKLALFRALARDVDPQPSERHDSTNEAPDQGETHIENNATGNNKPDSNKPARRELSPEEKRVSDSFLTRFLSNNQAVFKTLLPYSNIPRDKYPELLSRAILEFPPSRCCLTSPKAYLDYIAGRTKVIAGNIEREISDIRF